jgi:hypothetical protein
VPGRRQINNAQPAMPQPRAPGNIHPAVIGTAMLQGSTHVRNQTLIWRTLGTEIDFPANTAHRLVILRYSLCKNLLLNSLITKACRFAQLIFQIKKPGQKPGLVNAIKTA